MIKTKERKLKKTHLGDSMQTLLTLVLAIGLLAVLSVPAGRAQTNPAAQNPAYTAKSSPNPAQPDADKSKDTTIVFFREGHFTGSALKPSIFVDGKEVDRLANGRWFSVHAEPGKHELQSSAKNEPATVIETVAGQTTYVQMVILTGTWRGGGRLLQVDPADAQKVIAKLKPLHD
jgi:hypothetical protein